MAHDFEQQRSETTAVFDDLQARHGLPDVADVDYFFVPTSDEADWRALADVLSRVDYTCEWIEPEGEDAPYLVATLMDQVISATGIWIGEEVATRAALDHGFTPDGWGLEG